MKKLLVLVVLVVGGAVAYQYFTQPPDPAAQRQHAQGSDYRCVQYWVAAAKDGRMTDLLAVCDPAAKRQAELAVQELRNQEKNMRTACSNYTIFPMGAAGAFKTVFTSPAGNLLNVTIRAEKRNEKFWIVGVAQD